MSNRTLRAVGENDQLFKKNMQGQLTIYRKEQNLATSHRKEKFSSG